MDDRLTVAQSLRHARHDFMNELQMIKLNLDLGRTDRAQALIRTYAEAAMHQSRLSALSMPETEEWLLTAGWRFPELRLAVFCEAKRAPQELDAALCSWLEAFAKSVKEAFSDAWPYPVELHIMEAGGRFSLELSGPGDWSSVNLDSPQLAIGKACGSDRSKVEIHAQMEG
ncbi:Spo0B domain-containing protein [Planococcus maitriensis]|uniref:Sporulation protein n=1 Tax=Planococcus maitriensis TaxID=221799 RepID=A0A365K7F1_9BACL|nr:Spo0B domain-containing protein [Planococcus maitriensis]RAZ68561.1 sporulation protein [Planococcus maitriensis]